MPTPPKKSLEQRIGGCLLTVIGAVLGGATAMVSSILICVLCGLICRMLYLALRFGWRLL